jgi:hypothetical protein
MNSLNGCNTFKKFAAILLFNIGCFQPVYSQTPLVPIDRIQPYLSKALPRLFGPKLLFEPRQSPYPAGVQAHIIDPLSGKLIVFVSAETDRTLDRYRQDILKHLIKSKVNFLDINPDRFRYPNNHSAEGRLKNICSAVGSAAPELDINELVILPFGHGIAHLNRHKISLGSRINGFAGGSSADPLDTVGLLNGICNEFGPGVSANAFLLSCSSGNIGDQINELPNFDSVVASSDKDKDCMAQPGVAGAKEMIDIFGAKGPTPVKDFHGRLSINPEYSPFAKHVKDHGLLKGFTGFVSDIRKSKREYPQEDLSPRFFPANPVYGNQTLFRNRNQNSRQIKPRRLWVPAPYQAIELSRH